MMRSNPRRFFGAGLGLGTLLAFALSWFKHQSILWAVVHALYSWFYVAYFALTESGMMAPVTVPTTMGLAAALVAVVAVAAIVVFARRERR